MPPRRRLITVADDFGLTAEVNEAVDLASRDGILTSASLMVAAPFANDAVQRARANPKLHVGLHLVVIEGSAMLPATQIGGLVDARGMFPSEQIRLGVNYFFRPAIRRQLASEIRAQFEAFAATGLALDHANAHKHMHLHPVVGRMLIEIGSEFGLRAVRVPHEHGGGAGLRLWCEMLRRRARRAGLLTNDQVLGLANSGHMTPQRVQTMLENLPPGLTEMYLHPATRRDHVLRKLMPNYEHERELAALLTCLPPPEIDLISYAGIRERLEHCPEPHLRTHH